MRQQSSKYPYVSLKSETLLNLVYRTPKHRKLVWIKQAQTKEYLDASRLVLAWGKDIPVPRHARFITPSITFTHILYLVGKGAKILGLFLLIATGAQANIASDLMAFFKSSGMASNVTSPGVHKDQAAGYYTGGGFTVRTGSRTVQPATVQMPGFRAGCGGIDAWMGGFSHIGSSQIVEALRNIGASTASYAFMLAVQTVSPQIYNIMNELNALATKINQTNINSCEVAATMLGGIWPKTDQSSQHLCRAMGTNLGTFSDWSAARQGCGAKGDRGRVLNNRSGIYVQQYAEIIAVDILYTYVSEVMDQALSMIESTQLIEKQLHVMMGRLA